MTIKKKLEALTLDHYFTAPICTKLGTHVSFRYLKSYIPLVQTTYITLKYQHT